jgi:anthranilate synthase component 1
VQHIVSRVEGKLRKEVDCLDAYDAIFPAGTVTGAPKVRAMEIIAGLEAGPRGPYAGSVGYFSLNGNLDSAITIRTLAARRGKLRVQAGAGIVADSTPEGEWAETEAKAKALTSVLEGFG